MYSSKPRTDWLITRKELSLLCCNRFRYKLNFYFRIMAMMVDLGVGLYFLLHFTYLDYIFLSFAVCLFFALSILIGLCLTCSKCCSEVPENRRHRSEAVCILMKSCCSLYITLYQMQEQSRATNPEPVEWSNQIVNHAVTVIPG